MNIPFGVEKYNYKDILNLEFGIKNGDNNIHNFYVNMANIDDFFKKLSCDKQHIEKVKIPFNILHKIMGKTYVPSVRKRYNFDPLLRVYVKKNLKFINKDGSIISNIKSKTGTFTIVLDSLWISKYKYGIIWSIVEANIS
jgi:hypothetical protein